MASQQISTNTFGTAKWIVSPTASDGTHTTIGAALTSASSGDTIFIRPGTYTENLTLKAGVNLAAYDADALTPNVIIVGKATFSGTGVVSISGIQLKTNSDFCLVFSGSSASTVYLKNCYINANNNTAISYTTSNTSSRLQLFNCWGDIGTTGIGYWSSSSTGALSLIGCIFNNAGASSTASTNSAGAVSIFESTMGSPVSTSSTGQVNGFGSTIDTSATNATCFTSAGSSTNTFQQCGFSSGTASAISIGTGTSVALANCSINSTNTNAITGAGTLNYGTISFLGSSKTINTTTQTNANGGTFTPALKFGGGSTGLTYSAQNGTYSRIGSLVQFEITLVLSAKGSSTGNATITGMPFAAINSPTFPLYIAVGVTAPAGTTYNIAQITSTTLSLFGIVGGSGAAAFYTDASMSNTTQIFINGTYQI